MFPNFVKLVNLGNCPNFESSLAIFAAGAVNVSSLLVIHIFKSVLHVLRRIRILVGDLNGNGLAPRLTKKEFQFPFLVPTGKMSVGAHNSAFVPRFWVFFACYIIVIHL